MHISDGFLSPAVLAGGALVAGAGVAYGLKKLAPEKIVRVAMVSSVFFLASLVNVKVPPSSTHLSLIGATGLLLGPVSFPAIFVALSLQAILFQFGGLIALGANTAAMGTAAFVVHLLFGRAVRSKNIALAASFAAGFAGVAFAAVYAGAMLAMSDRGLLGAARTLALIHLPLAAVEGAATVLIVSFLRKTYPDMLEAAE
jgi:cobalt/nickel transport system permease protein